MDRMGIKICFDSLLKENTIIKFLCQKFRPTFNISKKYEENITILRTCRKLASKNTELFGVNAFSLLEKKRLTIALFSTYLLNSDK